MDWLLLRSLGEPELEAVLAVASRLRYRRGDVLFHEGDPGDSLHLLAAGASPSGPTPRTATR